MTAANPAGEEEVERALSDFLREMDAFVATWATAVRRFAHEPAALREFQERPTTEPSRSHHPAGVPWLGPPRDPMWDRDLDG